MDIKIYGIGGKLQAGSTGDCFVGTAYDTLTYSSLLDLVELKGGYMVSMHGTFGNNRISGEYSLTDARNLLSSERRGEKVSHPDPLHDQNNCLELDLEIEEDEPEQEPELELDDELGQGNEDQAGP